MTISDKTAPGQTEALSFELDLPHSPEKVWRALTEPELLAQWLLPAIGFQLEPGAAFTFEAQPFPDWDGTVNCQMLEVEPQRKLRYAWAVPFLATVVTFTLTPSASGTRLSIVQSGFEPEQKQNMGGARYGWRMMGTQLVALLGRLD
ncbi:MAG TPA: SRPBCC domain-containing protein [Polyangiaceae bacterium]|nr:SRPBCC domain-containing protein [Polyangiaceae bacterium]